MRLVRNPFEEFSTMTKEKTKDGKRSHRLNFTKRVYPIKGRRGWKERRKNKRKKGSRKSSVNSNVNDFKAGKIWWQFRLTIITTTRPHMSRCIRVTRNTLLHSLQRVIYRVQKHAYTACWESLQPFRESSPVSLRSLLRASKESSRVFFQRDWIEI